MKVDVFLFAIAMTVHWLIEVMAEAVPNKTIDILMPGITTQQEDEYWCTSIPSPQDESYIISFEALPDGDRAHHMLLFGCDEPGSYKDKWTCGTGCRTGSSILFAWALHAEPTHMPPDVAFTVGGQYAKYLSLQVHYKVVVKEKDHSGIRITITQNKPTYTAGILLMAAALTNIPPHREKHHIDISCVFPGHSPIYPFAYRVHAHSLGRVITGYQYNSSWHLLGKGNPQWPQAFYPVKQSLVIKQGDILVSRCTYNSMDQTQTVWIGSTHYDEMCNFYLMYYTNDEHGQKEYRCSSNAYPDIVAQEPADSDVTLPPNPLLESVAHGNLFSYHGELSRSYSSNENNNRGRLHRIRRDKTGDDDVGTAGGHTDHHRDGAVGHQSDGGGGGGGGDGAGGGGGGADGDNHGQFVSGAVHGWTDRRGSAFAGNHGAYSRRKGGTVGATEGGHIRPQRNLSTAHEASHGDGGGFVPVDGARRGRYGTNVGYLYPDLHENQHYPDDAYDFYSNQDEYSDDQDQFYHDVTNQRSRNRGHLGNGEQLPPQGKLRTDWQKTISRKPGPRFGQPSHGYWSHDHGPANQNAVIKTSTALPEITKTIPTSQMTNSISEVYSEIGSVSAKSSSKSIPNQQTNRTTRIEEVAAWPVQPPKLGQIAGVATDKDNNVHIFHRGTRIWDSNSFNMENIFSDKDGKPIEQDVLMTFDASGKLIDSWGKNMFYMPHGLHVDKQNNIWVTDVALHQVMRFPPGRHKPDLVLGEKFVPGTSASHFCKPTDVATLSNGQFYVSDGYCNHRVMKFSEDGKLIKEWGRSSSSLAGDDFPPPGDFTNPHSITVLEKSNIVCVADRENRRIQCFDLDGKFINQMHSPDIKGKVFAVDFDQTTGILYAVNGKDVYKDVTVEGFTFDVRSGKRLQIWSPTSGSFQQPHDIAVSADGTSVYVAEIGPNKIWKFNIVLSEGIHKSVKKNGHPPTVDEESDDDVSDEMPGYIKGSDFGASLIIGGLLIIPVVIVVIITIFLRLRKRGKLHYFFANQNRNRRLNLGTLLSRGRHRFSPLSTDDKDPELDLLNSDSEIEEYSVTENNTA